MGGGKPFLIKVHSLQKISKQVWKVNKWKLKVCQLYSILSNSWMFCKDVWTHRWPGKCMARNKESVTLRVALSSMSFVFYTMTNILVSKPLRTCFLSRAHLCFAHIFAPGYSSSCFFSGSSTFPSPAAQWAHTPTLGWDPRFLVFPLINSFIPIFR